MTNIFSYIGVFIVKLISYLPFTLLYVFSDVLYIIVYKLIGYRKKVVRENLRKSFPNKTSSELLLIEKKYYHVLCDIIVETTKLNTLTESEIRKRVKIKNSERFFELLKEGKSISMVLGHYLNWEWFVLALPLYTGVDTYGIYKPLTNKTFDILFKDMRSRMGMKMTPMQQIMRALLQAKQKPYTIAIVTDQTPSDTDNCYWTRFLNQDTPIFLGTEKIANHFDTAVAFLDMDRTKRGYIEFEFIILAESSKGRPEYEITELHTRYLENKINRKPEFWLWSHRRWKHQPKEEHKKKFNLS